MKIKLFLTFLILSGQVFARMDDPGHMDWSSPDIRASDFTSFDISYEAPTNESDLIKKMSFNPVVEVNTNRGTLKTSFRLDLPPNLAGLEKIVFHYNSNSTQKGPYGVGWDVDLPQVHKKNNAYGTKTYSLTGSLGNSNIVKTNEELGAEKGLVSSLSGELDEYQTYRAELEEANLLLIRNMSDKRWVVLNPQGPNWLFSKEGRPLRVVDRLGNQLQFEWKSDLLMKISAPQSWDASFLYDSEMLKSIQMTSVKTDEHRVLDFLIEDGYLLKVSWENGKLPLFWGEYQEIPTLKKQDKALDPVDDEGSYVFQESFEKPIFLKTHNKDYRKTEFYQDLTGDGRHERITIERPDVEKIIKEKLDAIDYKIKSANSPKLCNATPKVSRSKVQGWFDNFASNVHVDVAVMKNGEFSYQRDPKLSFTVKDIFVKVVDEKTSAPGCRNVSTYKPLVKIVSPKVVDIDENGLQDFLFCPAFNYEEKSKSGLEDVRSYLSSEKSDSMFESESAGGPVKVFSQFVDKSKVENVLFHAQEHPDNYLLGTRSFKRNKSAERFNCHNRSLFYDFSGNGSTDVLNGKTLIHREDGVVIEEKTIEVLDLFKLGPSSSADDKNLSLISAGPEAVLEILESEQLFFDGRLKKWRTASGSVYPALRRKLLSSFKSPFGGVERVTYKRVAGQVAVERVERIDSNDELVREKQFEYSDDIYDFFTGAFIGHQKTYETIKYPSENLEGSVVEKEYYSDSSPSVLLFETRARLNGRLHRVLRLGENRQRNFNEKRMRLDAVSLDHDRIYPYVKEKRSLFFSSSGDVQSVFNEEYSLENWAKNEGVFLAPLYRKKEAKFADDLINIMQDRADKVKETDYFFDQSSYQLLKSRETLQGSNDQKKLKTYSYSEQGLLLKESQMGEEQYFNYDDLGRVKEHKNPKGVLTKISYEDVGPFVRELSTPQEHLNITQSRLSGKTLYVRDQNELEHRLSYSADGIKARITRSSPEYGEVDIYEVLELRPYEKEVRLKKAETEYKMIFNDFGELEQVNSRFGEKDLVHFDTQKISGKKIRENRPYFSSGMQAYEAQIENWFDGMGRTTLRKEYGRHTDITRMRYEGRCKSTLKAGILVRKTCDDPWGRDVQDSYLGEQNYFDYDSSDNLIGLNESEARWFYSDDGFIQSILSSKGEDSRDRTEDKKQIRGKNDQRVEKNDFEQVIEFESGDFRENRKYDGKNLIQKKFSLDDEAFLTQDYGYNSYGHLTSVTSQNFNKSFEYDEYGKILSQSIRWGNEKKLELSYDYASNQVIKIDPFVSQIEYNAQMRPHRVEYASGLTLSLRYKNDGQTLAGLVYQKGSKVLYSKRYEHNGLQKIDAESIHYWQSIHSRSHSYSDSGRYNPQIRPHAKKRDSYGRVKDFKGLNFSYINDDLHKVSDTNSEHYFYYDSSSRLIAGCQERTSFDFLSDDCFYMPSRDEIFIAGEYIKIEKISGVPIGICLKGQFYPVVTGAKGEVAGLISPDGEMLLFVRDYSEWGAHELRVNPALASRDQAFNNIKLLDQLVVWNWSHLVTSPFLREKQIKWSMTRTYVDGEWVTLDPMFKWSPQSFQTPGNWRPSVYCDNDPVNCVDYSGNFAWLISGSIGLLVGGTAGAITAAANDKNILDGVMVGGITGFSIGVGGPIFSSMMMPGFWGSVANGALGSIFGFTANLSSQAFVHKRIDMGQGLASGISGGLAGTFSSLLGSGFSFFAKDLGTSMSMLPVDMGFSLTADKFGFFGRNQPIFDGGSFNTPIDDGFEQEFEVGP